MTDSVRYITEDNSLIKVEPEGWTIPQPCHTYHQSIIDAWVDEGFSIAPYDPYHGWTEEQIQAAKVSQAESIVEAHIAEVITTYNQANMLKFDGIHSVANYINTPTYTHYPFCVAAWAFNVEVWEAARQLQIDIMNGVVEEPTTNEEFIAHLPVFDGG